MAPLTMDRTARAAMSAPAYFGASAIEALVLFRLQQSIAARCDSTSVQGKLLLHDSFQSALLAVLAANLLLLSAFKLLVYNNFIAPLRHFPAPKGRSFFFGFYLSVLSENHHEHNLTWATEPAVHDQGVMLMRDLFGQDSLLITAPRALQEVLVTRSYDWQKTDSTRNFLRPILGQGLVVSEGHEHEFQKKHIKPSFGFRQIRNLYPMMFRKSDELCDLIAAGIKETGVNAVEMGYWSSRATIDIIGVAGLGTEFGALRNSQTSLVDTYEALLEPTFERYLYAVARELGPDKLVRMLPWRMNRVFFENTATLQSAAEKMVKDKRAAMKGADGDEHVDILSSLIRTGDFSDEDLTAHMLTFIGAGHETTAGTFSFVLYLLTRHAEFQHLIRDEVTSAMSDKSDNADLSTILESLPLLNGAINETLRLYPSVPFTSRWAVRDTVLLGHHIPAKTHVGLAIWVTNHHPDLWGPDAADFVPSRWINEDGTPNNSGGVDSNYAFMTFNHGPRACIGSGFARAELRCLLAAFIRKFGWELDMKPEDVVPGGAISMKPMNGMHLKLTDLS